MYIILQLTRCIPIVTIDFHGLTGKGVVMPWRKVHGKDLNDDEVAVEVLKISKNYFCCPPNCVFITCIICITDIADITGITRIICSAVNNQSIITHTSLQHHIHFTATSHYFQHVREMKFKKSPLRHVRISYYNTSTSRRLNLNINHTHITSHKLQGNTHTLRQHYKQFN